MTIFDHPGLPIDRVARRVTGRGEHWEPTYTRNAPCIGDESRMPMLGPPEECDPRPVWMPDYAGERRGRVVAFCYYHRRKGKAHVWVCRCDCGNFVFRRFPRWLKSNGMDCCPTCDEAHFAVHGVYLAKLERPTSDSSSSSGVSD